MKRLLDIALVMSTAWVTLPMIALTGLFVFLLLGRPIFFRQERASKDAVPFLLIKFRSMTDVRDRHGELLHDAERTPVFGKFIRRSRLDELPEIFNILRGEMTLVGPRPLLTETIAKLADRGRLRSLARPGLTGWAQISGNSLLSDNDKVDLDLWYIKNRNIVLDFKILFLTISVLIFGERPNTARLLRARSSLDGQARSR